MYMHHKICRNHTSTAGLTDNTSIPCLFLPSMLRNPRRVNTHTQAMYNSRKFLSWYSCFLGLPMNEPRFLEAKVCGESFSFYAHGSWWTPCYPVSHLSITKEIKQQPYKTDLRARSTTLRVAAGIEPAHMRFALQRANETGAKWKQMFRWDMGKGIWYWMNLAQLQLQLVIVWCIMLDCEQPNWLCHARPGYNDTVNEAFKVGCNSCILSMLYLKDTWQEHKCLGNSWFVDGCSTMKLFATHVMIYHDISRILHNSILLCLCAFCGCCKQNSMQACKGHTFHAVITSLFSFKAFIGGW